MSFPDFSPDFCLLYRVYFCSAEGFVFNFVNFKKLLSVCVSTRHSVRMEVRGTL